VSKSKKTVILAIETSLDETCAAISVENRVFSNVISSQIELHRKYGGVVPIIAKRAHEERLPHVIAEAFSRANYVSRRYHKSKYNFSLNNIDVIAVTYGPGQSLALGVGIDQAKDLAMKYSKSLVAVNHMEGHLLSSFVQNSTGMMGNDLSSLPFPALGLLVSGGHTMLVLVESLGKYKILGETLDDACGEAFDKVGRMLGIGYPGGPIVEQLAKEGNEDRFDLPVPMIKHKGLMFSYSGIKTSVLYATEKLKKEKQFKGKEIKDMAASFQRVVANSLTFKLERAIAEYRPQALLLGGGVISNLYIRSKLRNVAQKNGISLFTATSYKLLTDNAAMIAVAGYHKFRRNELIVDPNRLDRDPNASL